MFLFTAGLGEMRGLARETILEEVLVLPSWLAGGNPLEGAGPDHWTAVGVEAGSLLDAGSQKITLLG